MEIFGLVLGFALILTLIVDVLLAIAVYRDAAKLVREGGRPFLIGPVLWAVVTIAWGLAAVAVYWAIHHSNLNPFIAKTGHTD